MRSILYVVSVILCGVLMISCSSDPGDEFIGIWKHNNSNDRLEFLEDGTVKYYNRGTLVTGKYSFLDDGHYRADYNIADGTTKSVVGQYVFDGDQIIFTNLEDGYVSTWTRGKTETRKAELDRQGELDRHLAEDMLNEHLKTLQVFKLTFSHEGIDQAVKDGVVKGRRITLGTEYYFTPKGLGLIGDNIQGNVIRRTPSMTERTYYKFSLKEPLSEDVYEITGITALQFPGMGADSKKVEYTSNILFPEKMEGIIGYVVHGWAQEIEVFQKYDDGWRIAK